MATIFNTNPNSLVEQDIQKTWQTFCRQHIPVSLEWVKACVSFLHNDTNVS